MREANTPMFVGIEEPSEKRKHVLNSAIETIEILRGYERFRKLRRESGIHKNDLRVLMKEVKLLFNEIGELMPTVELPKEEEKKQEIKPKQERVVIKPVKKQHHLTKLEMDLQSLKDKIAKI